MSIEGWGKMNSGAKWDAFFNLKVYQRQSISWNYWYEGLLESQLYQQIQKKSFGKYQNYDAKVKEFSKIKKNEKNQKPVTTAKMLVCMRLAVFCRLYVCVEKKSSLNFSKLKYS